MSKIVIPVAISALFLLASCQCSQQSSESQESEPVMMSDNELNSSLVKEAMGIYSDFCKAEQNIANMTIMYDEAQMNEEILMPNSYASKAQTRAQYAKLLGVYTADAFIQKMYLCNIDEAKNKYNVCAKLYADLNISISLDSIEAMVELANKDFIMKRGADMVENFRQALESGDADIQIVITNFFNIEMNNFFENCPVAAEQWKEQPGSEESAILLHDRLLALYNLLSPYYESMANLSAIAEKLEAIKVAEHKAKALQDYRTYCCMQRKALESELK